MNIIQNSNTRHLLTCLILQYLTILNNFYPKSRDCAKEFIEYENDRYKFNETKKVPIKN